MGLPHDAPLISVSDHAYEVPEIFAGCLPGRAEDVPRVVDLPDGSSQAWRFGDVLVGIGRNFPIPADDATSETRFVSRMSDVPEALRAPAARLGAMDRDGVRTQVLFPQAVGFAGEQLLHLGDAAARAAACRAYNDHMTQAYHATAPERLVPIAVVPMAESDAAAAELRRAVSAGCRGVSLSCNPANLGLPSWHESHWDPVLDAAVECDVPVFVHIATMRTPTDVPHVAHGSTPGGPLGALLTMMNLDAMTTVVEIAYSPVLVHHPRLRIVVLEGGAAWFPFICERIDVFWANRGERGRGPGTVRDRRPSQLVDQAISLGFIEDPAAIRSRADVGIHRMMWMSDFPHEDGHWPNNRAMLTELLRDVPETDARAFTSGNAAALLHLEA